MRMAAEILLLAGSLQAADWISLKSGDIELVSDAPERIARQSLYRLAQVRGVLTTRESPNPLRMFLFASSRDYRETAPAFNTSGFYQSGQERDYIATHAGASSLPRVVMHEYVHFALHHGSRPAWLEEGVAEYYSNLEFKKGDFVRFGVPIPENVALLEREQWLTAEQMAEPRHDGLFYAQSWALVHMLIEAPRIPDRVTDQMLRDLRGYFRRMRPRTIKIVPTPSPSLSVEPVSPLKSLLLRADLALATQHHMLARSLYTEASRQFPDSSGAATGLAMLASLDGDRDAARSHLLRALALNQEDANAWFQFALLEGDDTALRKAAELNPNLGEAQLLLGVHATDDGDLDRAIEYLESAVELLPRKSSAWYSLAFAQQKNGDDAATITSLNRALRTATSPEDTAMANALLESLR